MKKTLLLFALCLIAGIAKAVEPQQTDDRIVISDLTVSPDGTETYFTVSLQGSRIYTAYNMDIHLPEGLEVAYKSGKPNVTMGTSKTRPSSFYPSTSQYDEDLEMDLYDYSHKLAFSYGVLGERWLRLACSCDVNSEFIANSGDLFKVYVKASPYMKPGEAHITVDGIALVVKENAVKYVPQPTDKTITVGTTSKVTINVNAENQWSTCVLPFDAAIPDGLTAYECADATDDMLLLSKATSIEAYTPYILYAPMGYTNTLSGEVDASKYVPVATKGLLSGAIVGQSISSGYVLQNQGDGAMFYDVDGDTFVVPEGRCWLSESATLTNVRYGFVDEAIGIAHTYLYESNSNCYNLQGVKINKANKGIVIFKDKKILLR